LGLLKLESALFGEPASAVARRQKPAPDFAVIERELQSHEHVTLQLLWEEYRQAHPESYAYSRFCILYIVIARRLTLLRIQMLKYRF
jgi:transposase